MSCPYYPDPTHTLWFPVLLSQCPSCSAHMPSFSLAWMWYRLVPLPVRLLPTQYHLPKRLSLPLRLNHSPPLTPFLYPLRYLILCYFLAYSLDSQLLPVQNVAITSTVSGFIHCLIHCLILGDSAQWRLSKLLLNKHFAPCLKHCLK